MGKKITFSELQAEADKSFGDLEVDDVIFRPLLRLGDQKRKKAEKLLNEVNGLRTEATAREDLAAVDKLTTATRSLLTVVSTDEKAAAALLNRLDDAELMTLLNMWGEETQPGEASSSSS
jgi:hypothetical protein